VWEDYKTFRIEFYFDRNDNSEIVDFLKALYKSSKINKHDRINHDKIATYMGLLKKHGTYIGEPVVKHIVGDIWELRPMNNRIFFFYWKDNLFIMLHHYIKKTNKIPPQELRSARAKLNDHIERHGE
jgi:phage-related protein